MEGDGQYKWGTGNTTFVRDISFNRILSVAAFSCSHFSLFWTTVRNSNWTLSPIYKYSIIRVSLYRDNPYISTVHIFSNTNATD